MKNIILPSPRIDPATSLLVAWENRRAIRSFEPHPLEQQTLSNLLWAAFGINRPTEGRRTAPSAFNWQEIDIYGVTATNAWKYDPVEHHLQIIETGDLRHAAGTQDYVFTAPLSLVYIANLERMTSPTENLTDEHRTRLAFCHAGLIAQNVNLYCAATGLGAVVRASVSKKYLQEPLRLTERQLVTIGQTVGYPKEN